VLRRAGLLVGLALCAVLAACGDDDDATPVAAASGSTLLAQIPTLGEAYPAQLARFVDTDEGKDYGLAVTVADDGRAVAYLCDGKTLGRAFSGSIEDGAGKATLKAVKGDGTVELTLSGDTLTGAAVKMDDATDAFTLASTKVGGYFREQVKGVTRGWVVSDTLAIKGVQTDESGGKGKATTTGVSSPPLSAEDQALVGAEEDPSAPPETAGFLLHKRCAFLKRRYDAAFDVYDSSGREQDADAVNIVLARGDFLGCGWANDRNPID